MPFAFPPEAVFAFAGIRNKHIAGGVPQGQTGQFVVFYNYTNSSDWDTSGFALSTYGAFGTGSCTPYNGPTPTYTGVVLKGFVCTADFSGKDSAIYGLYATVKPSSIYANGAGYRPRISISSFSFLLFPLPAFSPFEVLSHELPLTSPVAHHHPAHPGHARIGQ
jgi:hypothetical protein